MEKQTLTCQICERVYSYHHSATAGHTKTKCNSCSVNERRIKIKERCLEYKGGKCQICGYNKSKRALSFHHISGKKEFALSGSHCKKWESIQEELDKCMLVCANCHMELHEADNRKVSGSSPDMPTKNTGC